MTRKILTGSHILAIAVLAVIGVAIFFALKQPSVEVDVTPVTRGPLTVTVGDEGETRVRNLYVVSAPISGELMRVPLKPGDRVAQGALLARIQPAQPGPLDARALAQTSANIDALDAQLGAARQRVVGADAAARQAAQEYARVSALSRRGFVSQARLDGARMERDRSRAGATEARRSVDAGRHSLEAARAALVVAQSGRRGLGAIAVTAPVEGYVLTVPQESERFVVAGTPLLDIGDPEQLEYVVDLLSADAVRVRPGAPVWLEDWGGERPLGGRVRLVEPFGFTKVSALGVEEQRVNVVIDLSEPRQRWARLGHGYRAVARIVVWRSPSAVRVPIGALFRSGGRWAVFRAGEDGRARLTNVEVGEMNDSAGEVRAGLTPGARVILHPGEKVADGVRIKVRRGG